MSDFCCKKCDGLIPRPNTSQSYGGHLCRCAPAPTCDEGTPTHLVTDDKTGQMGVDAGFLKKFGHQTYEISGDAPAPAGGEDIERAARRCATACVDEACKYQDILPPSGVAEMAFKDIHNVMAGAIAATEARVRAEVWKKAHAVMNNVMTWLGTGVRPYYDAAAEAGSKAIEKAALADGVVLTSLTDDDARA